METKKKRGRPPKIKVSETTGMTYDGAINYALDKQVKSELDKSLANKDESQLTDDERKYLETKKENKACTLNQSLSGLKQKRFRKKNTDAIDGYELADKYIKEHIKAYKADSNTPTVAELKERSQTMKDEHNDLLRERISLEKKHAITSQYSRSVRNYIAQQTNKRAAEQSRQRRLTQQKKKDTLE